LKVTVLKSELAKVRAEEKQKAAKRGPKKKSGKEAHVLAGLAKKRIDEMREALLVLKRAYDDDHARVLELQGILRGLKLGYDPNFNDYAVKRAVRSWEEFDVRENDASGRWPKPAIPDVGKLAEEDGPTSGINFQAWEAPEPEEKTLGKSGREGNSAKWFVALLLTVCPVEQILPPFLATIVPETIDKVGRWLAENGVIAPRHDDSDEPRAVREARERLEAEEGTLMNTQSKLGEYKEDLSKDFGKDDVFRALKDTCISKDSGEYTYELCWMDQTKQKSKKGGGVTNMGNYEGVTTVTVDETSAEGLVVPREKVALEFSNGHTCWNGPPRSTKVILECGAVDEILKITEDEKCVYSMQVITPAVCELLTDGKPAGGRKDEL
jgi:protein kinase C substrate 80K-H